MKEDIKFYEGQLVRLKSREELQLVPGCISTMRTLHGQQATITKISRTTLTHAPDTIRIDLDKGRFAWSSKCFEQVSYGRNDFIL